LLPAFSDTLDPAYAGDTPDATATIKLLEAIKDIKNYALPSEVGTNES
jgi:hypothetical protein